MKVYWILPERLQVRYRLPSGLFADYGKRYRKAVIKDIRSGWAKVRKRETIVFGWMQVAV